MENKKQHIKGQRYIQNLIQNRIDFLKERREINHDIHLKNEICFEDGNAKKLINLRIKKILGKSHIIKEKDLMLNNTGKDENNNLIMDSSSKGRNFQKIQLKSLNNILDLKNSLERKKSEKINRRREYSTNEVDDNKFLKKFLVLDLDETLIHSSSHPVEGADFIIPVI